MVYLKWCIQEFLTLRLRKISFFAHTITNRPWINILWDVTHAALAIPKFFTLRPWKTRFLLKKFPLHDSEHFISGGTVIKLLSRILRALKTPVDRHPIGCHTRCTRHS